MEPIEALTTLGGAARRERLLAMGVSRRQLNSAVRAGTVLRPYYGCYATAGAREPQVMSALFRGTLTCISALEAWGVPLIGNRDSRVHLALPRDRGVAPGDRRWREDVVLHRGPAITGVRAIDVVSVVRHASRCLEFPALVVVTDHLLATRAIDRRALDELPGRIGGRLRATATSLAQSPPETLGRLALLQAGYEPVAQVSFKNVGRVDLVVGDCVVVEIDGLAYHSGQAAFVRDRRRDRALTHLGYRVLRFAAIEVLDDPSIVSRAVERVIGPARGQALAG